MKNVAHFSLFCTASVLFLIIICVIMSLIAICSTKDSLHLQKLKKDERERNLLKAKSETG